MGLTYVLASSLPAVQLGIDSSGRLTRIPEGSSVRVQGAANAAGLITVRWQDNVFGVFEIDLHQRSSLEGSTHPPNPLVHTIEGTHTGGLIPPVHISPGEELS